MRSDNAFLLKKQPYQENGYLAVFLTHQYGVCRTFISNKGLCHQLNLFFKLVAEFNETGEIKRLINAKPAHFYPLPKPYLICGLYLNELIINSLGVGDVYSEIFNCYQSTLSHLQIVDDLQALEWLLRHFELNLLEQLGYSPTKMTKDLSLSEALGCMYEFQEIQKNHQGFLPACKKFLRQQIDHLTAGRLINFRRFFKNN